MDEAIRWTEWEQGVRIFHFDQSCSCGFPGPLQVRHGYVLKPGGPVRKLTRRSDIASGVRPQARTAWGRGGRELTHIAFWCLERDAEVVYRYRHGDEGTCLVEVPQRSRPERAQAVVVEFPDKTQR